MSDELKSSRLTNQALLHDSEDEEYSSQGAGRGLK